MAFFGFAIHLRSISVSFGGVVRQISRCRWRPLRHWRIDSAALALDWKRLPALPPRLNSGQAHCPVTMSVQPARRQARAVVILR